MPSTLPQNTAPRQYRRDDPALDVAVAMGLSATVAGAHTKELRTWADARRFLRAYVRCGRLARAEAHLEALEMELCAAPAVPLNQAIRLEGRAGRDQDDAAERAMLGGATAAELDQLDARSLRQILELRCLRRGIAAEKASRR